MVYYRVKKEHDNRARKDGSILVQNELYTEREVKKFCIPMTYLDKVVEKKSEIYWLFGARFGSIGHSD